MSNKATPIMTAIVLGAVALTPLFLVSCGDNPKAAILGNKADSSVSTTSTGSITAQSPDKAKAGYSVGYMIGTNAKKAASDLDKGDILQGFNAAYATDKPALTEQEMEKVITDYQQRRQGEMQKEMEAKGKANLEKGQAFLAENGKKQGVKTTASGLQYEVLKEGTGAKPKATDIVAVNYEGKLIDGKVFDSNAMHGGEPAVFPLNRVIPGWTEGVQLMTEGSKYRFYVPANLAYGEAGAPQGGIEPNSVLQFDVELLKINPPAENKAGAKGKPSADADAQIKAAIEAAQKQQAAQPAK